MHSRDVRRVSGWGRWRTTTDIVGTHARASSPEKREKISSFIATRFRVKYKRSENDECLEELD